MYCQERDNLKIKLNSVIKLKLCKASEELALRNTELILSEEMRLIQVETEKMSLQLEDLKQEISKLKYQIAMIDICEASEKSKINNNIINIEHHQKDFGNLFSKEHEAIEMLKLEIKKREQEQKEIEQRKEKNIQEKNQLLQQEAKRIEDECDTMEQECAVLTKRNKAIMLKLRRKLIESEDARRSLMQDVDTPKSELEL